MTKEVEALKLALEALETINQLDLGLNEYATRNLTTLEAFVKSTITAIKESLAQPFQEPARALTPFVMSEEDKRVCFDCTNFICGECRHSHGPLCPHNGECGGKITKAQPVQGPGAYFVNCTNCGEEKKVQRGNHHPWCFCGSDSFDWGNSRDEQQAQPFQPAQPAQPSSVQEPVAWLDPEGDEDCNVITASWKRKMQAMSTQLEQEYARKHTVPVNASPPARTAPVQQTCNCRWEGEVQVQQCTLHEAHVDAIHEWAERAKAAETKLKAHPAQRPWAGLINIDWNSIAYTSEFRAGAQWAERLLNERNT